MQQALRSKQSSALHVTHIPRSGSGAADRGGTMGIREPYMAHVRVHDAMHTGILTTDPTTPLRTVAKLMADQRVHAVAVADPDHSRRPWGIITAMDIAAAASEDLDIPAG